MYIIIDKKFSMLQITIVQYFSRKKRIKTFVQFKCYVISATSVQKLITFRSSFLSFHATNAQSVERIPTSCDDFQVIYIFVFI